MNSGTGVYASCDVASVVYCYFPNDLCILLMFLLIYINFHVALNGELLIFSGFLMVFNFIYVQYGIFIRQFQTNFTSEKCC
jgi:hypothetical protein